MLRRYGIYLPLTNLNHKRYKVHSLRISNDATGQLRGKVNYIHSNGSNAVTAFEFSEDIKIRFLLPRKMGVVSVDMLLYEENCSVIKASLSAIWIGTEYGNDVYEVRISEKNKSVGLYFFNLKISCIYGCVFGSKFKEELLFTETRGQMFQLSISDFKYPAPEKKYGGIIYHIFVDRFNRGGNTKCKDNAILVEDWSDGIPEYPAYPGAPLKNNRFYGGTLFGIIEKLDYISSLGVDTIYLSPIFDAASNHKYDTGDYMTVDSMFGGDDALSLLITEAKKYGIGIILDGVFNHTGADSVYFNREGNYDSIGAFQSEESKYYSWYDFQSFPLKYTCWWGIQILPRINTDKPECRRFFTGEGGVIEKYAKVGIDGFRLDVADELSDDFIADIKSVLSRYNPGSVLYGEVWEDASNKIAYDKRKQYYLGRELDGVMNYPVRTGIINFIRYNSADALYYALTDIINNAPPRIRNMQMNLLGTHDTERILTTLAADPSDGRSNEYLSKKRMTEDEVKIGIRRLEMAYTILATLPGIPSIFYGDEAGLQGYHDPFNRMPYPWGRENRLILDFYRKIGKIRRKSDVYKKGEFKLLHLDSQILIFERYTGKKAFITFINNSKDDVTVKFSKKAKACISDTEKLNFVLKALSSEIFEIERNSLLSIIDTV